MKSKILKEVFIIILLVIVIVFTLGILFYDSISIGSKPVSSVQYEASSEVEEVLNEIQESSGTDINEKDSLLKSYTINKDDLNVYANENYYESGKKDPFAENSEDVEVEETTTTTSTNKNNTESNNTYIANEETESSNINENKVTNETSKNGSTTGTFFENKMSTFFSNVRQKI